MNCPDCKDKGVYIGLGTQPPEPCHCQLQTACSCDFDGTDDTITAPGTWISPGQVVYILDGSIGVQNGDHIKAIGKLSPCEPS